MTQYRVPDFELASSALAGVLTIYTDVRERRLKCLPFFLPSQISSFLGVPILWCTNRLFQMRNALKELGKRPNEQHTATHTFSLCLQELALCLQVPGRQKPWCHKGVAGAAPSCVGTSPGASDRLARLAQPTNPAENGGTEHFWTSGHGIRMVYMVQTYRTEPHNPLPRSW